MNNLLIMSQRRQAGKAHLAAEPVLQDGLSTLAERVGAAGVEAGEHVLPHRVAVNAVHGDAVRTARRVVVDAIHGGIAGRSKHDVVGVVAWWAEHSSEYPRLSMSA